MAIERLPNQPNSDELNLVFNNGDYQALQDAVRRLGFRNEESMLRFALAVLSRSATRSISITDQNGEKINLNPGDALLQQDEPSDT